MVEPGIDLNITVGTPGGSVNTLPPTAFLANFEYKVSLLEEIYVPNT
jgi:hypothetical protein